MSDISTALMRLIGQQVSVVPKQVTEHRLVIRRGQLLSVFRRGERRLLHVALLKANGRIYSYNLGEFEVRI